MYMYMQKNSCLQVQCLLCLVPMTELMCNMCVYLYVLLQ